MMMNYTGICSIFNEKILELKQRTNRALLNLLPEERQTDIRGVNVVGEEHLGIVTENSARSQPLVVTKTWIRKHNDKWVYGASLHNSSDRFTLCNIFPMLRNMASVSVSLHFYTQSSNTEIESEPPSKRIRQTRLDVLPSTEPWKCFTELPPNTVGYILVILEDDKNYLLDEVNGILGCISYSVKGDSFMEYVQDVPPVVLKPDITAKDSEFMPFDKEPVATTNQAHDIPLHNEFAPDLLTIMLTSENVVLRVKIPLKGEVEPLKRVLMRKLKFEKASLTGLRTTLYHRGDLKPELAGIMILAKRDNNNEYTVNAHVRNILQIGKLIRCMYCVLPDYSLIYIKKVSTIAYMADRQNAVRSEIAFVKNQLSTWIENKEKILVPRETYSVFLQTLRTLMLKTDQIFLSRNSCAE